MTDLVQKLVGALEGKLRQMEMAGDAIEAGRYDEALLHVRSLHSEARSALSAAKDGGWVAVPVEPTPEMIHEVEHAARLGAVWTAESVYKAMLAARPLPNPPKEQNT